MNILVRQLRPLLKLLKRLKRRLTPYRNPIAILGGRQVGMDGLRRAVAPALVERGRDDSVLIIAFTGDAGALMMPVYDFFETTKLLGYSRILLHDQYHKWYHRGIDDQRPDFPSLIAYLREEIKRLGPQKVLCIGTSIGGYAAIRAGHELGADYVHAFSPPTGEPPVELEAADAARLRFVRHKSGIPALDLSQILKTWNKKTVYYIHYCRACKVERYHAERMVRSPGIVTIGYPCSTHLVTVFLAKKGFLTEALAIANQDRLGEIAKAHFGESLAINELQSDRAGSHSE